jgi:hypothetical protein
VTTGKLISVFGQALEYFHPDNFLFESRIGLLAFVTNGIRILARLGVDFDYPSIKFTTPLGDFYDRSRLPRGIIDAGPLASNLTEPTKAEKKERSEK